MAMDFLPVQATSVPCEQVFSSAKETDTAKQNWISPVLMEALQLLKFSLKKKRLDFMAGWAMPESAMDGTPKPNRDLLNDLIVGNPKTAMEDILNELNIYDHNS